MGEEIPIWVDGAVQWLSGVDRKTTVKDVIELFIEGGAGGDPASYEIVERWREVERPLDLDSKLLKVRNKIRKKTRRCHTWQNNDGLVGNIGARLLPGKVHHVKSHENWLSC